MIASAELAKVQGYIDGVLSGDIVVGDLVRAAVKRHLRDLERQRTPDFPYYFDAHDAECACAFFPATLCHSIGDYAGQPFHLEPWQAFGIAMVHGWKRLDGSRRFRRVYWSMGRKNGKSTLGGGEAIQLASMDINPVTMQVEQVAEVILAATKREQVEKVMFAEIGRMRQTSPAIKTRSILINKQLTFNHNSGFVRCVGSDKPYSGLNPLCVIKDELHEFREYHRKFLETMDTGGGSRSQPLDIVFTTAGDTQALIWIEVYNYHRAVVLGEINDESVFTLCFEIDPKDDPLDESNWLKANPNLGVSLKWEYLRDQATKAKSSHIELNTFTRFHANRVVSSISKAFDLVLWDKCKGELSDWSQADAIGGGIDVGGRDDLAAWGMVARFETGEFVTTEDEDEEPKPVYRYEAKIGAYISDSSTRDLTQQPFAEWIHEDILHKCKHPISQMTADVITECFRHGVADVAYDPAGGQHLSEEIEKEGITIASMAQSTSHFTEPINDMMSAIREGRFTHDGNPLLRWCAGNAVLSGKADKCMFDKANATGKIDPIVAMTMAYRRAMVAPRRPVGSMFIT